MKQDTLQILGTIWLVGAIIYPPSITSTLMIAMGVVLLVASLFCKEEK
jgi:hypothetical protein